MYAWQWHPQAQAIYPGLTSRSPAHARRAHHQKNVASRLYGAVADPRVLVLSLVYFGTAAASYALGFWLPTIVKDFGVTISRPG